ncbi:hypothetical protein ACOSP7_008329 [Xanthoceras sorbifolium]
MEFYGQKTLFSFMDEERMEFPQSPTHRHNLSIKTRQEMCEQDLQFSPPRPSSPHSPGPVFTLLPPPSPESPWTLSPLQTPSPSILYLEEARSCCFQKQTANNTKTAYLAWLITMRRGFCTPARMTQNRQGMAGSGQKMR